MVTLKTNVTSNQISGQDYRFAADLIPTVGHIPLVYVMGYDTRPLLTVSEKKNS